MVVDLPAPLGPGSPPPDRGRPDRKRRRRPQFRRSAWRLRRALGRAYVRRLAFVGAGHTLKWVRAWFKRFGDGRDNPHGLSDAPAAASVRAGPSRSERPFQWDSGPGGQPSRSSRLLGGVARRRAGRPGQEQRFAAEGILHRADNLRFPLDRGRRSAGRHLGGSPGVDRGHSPVAPDSQEREGGGGGHTGSRPRIRGTPGCERVRISVGSGRSLETWSFVPPDSPDAWTQDIRAVIRGGTANPAGRR